MDCLPPVAEDEEKLRYGEADHYQRGGERESVHIITVLRSYHTAIARFSIKIRIKRYGCLTVVA